METTTYSNRSNAQRAARKAIGFPAQEGVHFVTKQNDDGLWEFIRNGGSDPEAAIDEPEVETQEDAADEVDSVISPVEEEPVEAEQPDEHEAAADQAHWLGGLPSETDRTDEPAARQDDTIESLLAEYVAADNRSDAFIESLLRRASEIGRPVTARKPTAKREGPTKRQLAADLLLREEGTTSREILEATGWPSVSIPAIAKASNISLRKVKDGSTTRYFGS